MRAQGIGAPLIAAALTAGCGGSSPSAPSTASPPANISPAVTQGIVGATLTQATSALLNPMPVGSSTTITCPGGGSMTVTTNVTLPSGPAAILTTSTRTEFNDCRSQTVTMNGDPYLTMAGEHVFVRGADGLTTGVTTTLHMTGGVRFDAGGTQGHARYDCTEVMSLQLVNGAPSQPSISSSGTITWEQPLGSVTVRPCGP